MHFPIFPAFPEAFRTASHKNIFQGMNSYMSYGNLKGFPSEIFLVGEDWEKVSYAQWFLQPTMTYRLARNATYPGSDDGDTHAYLPAVRPSSNFDSEADEYVCRKSTAGTPSLIPLPYIYIFWPWKGELWNAPSIISECLNHL